jgi:hypothetical protein
VVPLGAISPGGGHGGYGGVDHSWQLEAKVRSHKGYKWCQEYRKIESVSSMLSLSLSMCTLSRSG